MSRKMQWSKLGFIQSAGSAIETGAFGVSYMTAANGGGGFTGLSHFYHLIGFHSCWLSLPFVYWLHPVLAFRYQNLWKTGQE